MRIFTFPRHLQTWIFGLCLLALLPSAACQSASESEAALTARQAAEKNRLALAISASIVQDFVPLEKTTYNEKELAALFANMRESANPFCRILWGQKRYSTKVASKLIVKDRIRAYLRDGSRGLKSLTAGCWNFFIMNDKKPDLDFDLVKRQYPGKSFDCYSVGFLQPYIMHAVMGCDSLTMLDIDWRIMDGHSQLLKKYRNKQLSNPEQIAGSIASLHIGWVAHSGPTMKERNVVKFPFYCKRHKQNRLCEKYVLDFQGKMRDLARIRLNLTALHEAAFENPNRSLVKVVYLSNAIEKIYTSQKQFNQMLKNLEKSMAPGGKAVMIHHAGGRQQFGVYELKRAPAGLETRTICRDLYENTAIGATARHYKTYFEKISLNKRKIPRCAAYLKKLQSQIGGDQIK